MSPPQYVSENSDASPTSGTQSEATKRAREGSSSSDELLPDVARRRKSQQRRSPDAKLRNVLATLSDLDLSLYDLLAEARKVSEASTEVESQWQTLVEDLAEDDRCQLQPQLIRHEKCVSRPSGVGIYPLNGCSDWEVKAKQVLRDEVQAVGRSEVFGTWKEEDSATFFTNKLPQAIAVIGQHAPHLTEILRVISLPVGDAPLEAKQGSLVSFFSILCHAQQPRICSNIPTQMSLYLHTNGVNKSVIQTLHRMGACVNYDASTQAVKELSAKTRLSGQFNGMGSIPSIRNHVNGGTNPSSRVPQPNVAQRTEEPVRGRGRPRKDLHGSPTGANRQETAVNRSPPDERAILDQQLGVQSPTVQPPNLNFGFKRPQWQVTQSPRANGQPAGGSPSTAGPAGPAGDKAPETTTHTMRPVEWPSKAPNQGFSTFRSATLTNAASDRGYGLLVPPHRSTPANHHNKGGTITFRVNRQASNTAAPVPPPPLPPALMNPALPPTATPQEKLQYAMIMHNHSRLNQGQG